MKSLKKRFAALLTVVVAAVAMLGVMPVSAAQTYSVTVTSKEKYQMAYQALTLINKERTKNGLSSLKMDKSLLDAAMQRSAEQRILFDHVRPDGTDCFTAFDWQNCAAENIAFGQTSASDVCETWMNSAGHRGNILTADFKSTGIGCAYIDGTYYWTQVFSGGSGSSVTKPSDKTVSRTVKVSSQFKSKYLPSAAPKISSVVTDSDSATVKWSKAANASGYRVYKYNAKTKSYKALANVASSKTSYTDKTVKPGETVKYKVKAYRKSGAVTGWSSYSAAKSATVAPSRVTISSASSSKNAVRLNWNKISCTGYKIYRYDPITRKYRTVATLGSGTTTYRVSGLSRKTSYKFKMRAYVRLSNGSAVFGPYSAVKTVTTK